LKPVPHGGLNIAHHVTILGHGTKNTAHTMLPCHLACKRVRPTPATMPSHRERRRVWQQSERKPLECQNRYEDRREPWPHGSDHPPWCCEVGMTGAARGRLSHDAMRLSVAIPSARGQQHVSEFIHELSLPLPHLQLR
jgi:hypothetical protein